MFHAFNVQSISRHEKKYLPWVWTIICKECVQYWYPWHHSNICRKWIDFGKFICMLYCCYLSLNNNHICMIIYLSSSRASPPLISTCHRHLDPLQGVFVMWQKSAISGQRIQPLLVAPGLSSELLTNFVTFSHDGLKLYCCNLGEFQRFRWFRRRRTNCRPFLLHSSFNGWYYRQ